MQRFLKPDEGLADRKKDFQYLLFTVVAEEELTARQFADTLANTIFTRQYLLEYRWPNQV